METEKRMAENYEILHAISVGKKEVVFGCDEKAEYPYMTAFCERNDILIFYNDVVVSADYVEILEEFGKRVAEAAKDLRESNEKESAYIGDNAPYDLARIEEMPECRTVSYQDDLHGKVIIIDPEVLKPEFRKATSQLLYCTGGFGASPYSRGSACFCRKLYNGESVRFERRDVLATMDPKALPHWAKENYEKAHAEMTGKTHNRKEAR